MRYVLPALVLAVTAIAATPVYAHDDCPHHRGSREYVCKPVQTTEYVWVKRVGWHYEYDSYCCEEVLVYGPYWVKECRMVTRWECRPVECRPKKRSCERPRFEIHIDW